MRSGGKIDATQAPGRGGGLDSMRVEYSEPLAAWVFPRQGTHGSYAVHRMDGYPRTRFVYFSSKCRGLWKKQSHVNQRTTNSTGRLHNDQHRAACTPHCTLYSSQESRSLHIFRRFPSDAVYSQRCGYQGIRKKMYHGNLTNQRRLLRKRHQKDELRAEHPSDQTNKRAF